MYRALLFIFGLVIGSFLNVVIARYNPDRWILSIHQLLGRSRCSSCHKTLRWYELIPVISFLIQGGRCRSCGVLIPMQYLLVELASGFIFLLPFYLYTVTMSWWYIGAISSIWILVALIGVMIWCIDFKTFIIPNELNGALAILGIGLTAVESKLGLFNEFAGSFSGSFAGMFGLRENIWINHGVAALIALFIIGGIVLITRGRGMGIGDLKLVGALGLLFGWPDSLFIIMLSFFIGAGVSVCLLLQKKKTLKDALPFGPFLILASTLIFFFGNDILGGYFAFFSNLFSQ
ncbi:MAG: prepilin peptidase [bacterium]|nr:prepilin peptidase [bacterium]